MPQFIVGDVVRRKQNCIDSRWLEKHSAIETYRITDKTESSLYFGGNDGPWQIEKFDMVSGYRDHGSAKKESDGKAPLELLFKFPGLKDVADIFGSSMRKYPDIDGDFNFRKGRGDMAYKMRLVGAGLRHVFAYMQGEKLDKESGKPHIAHAICNFMMVGDLDL